MGTTQMVKGHCPGFDDRPKYIKGLVVKTKTDTQMVGCKLTMSGRLLSVLVQGASNAQGKYVCLSIHFLIHS